MAAARHQVLRLYRQILRESLKFSSYNYREYAVRKTKDGFRSNQNITDSNQIQSLLRQAEESLGIIRRQALLSNIYGHEKLVIEKP